MKLISWNVNGIKTRYNDGTLNKIFELEPYIFCIQELKQKPEKLGEKILNFEGYTGYFYPSESENDVWGGAHIQNTEPISLYEGFGDNNKFDKEGRIQRFEFKEFNLYNVYVPSGSNKERKPLKYEFYEIFTKYVMKSKKPQVICGDFNRIAADIDDFDINKHKYHGGGSRKRRTKGMVSKVFRKWIYRYVSDYSIIKLETIPSGLEEEQKRINNGYRFDYFLVNEELKDNVVDASILHQIPTDDHAPITLELEF